MSDIADMMHGIPPQLAAAWGGWLAVGLLLLLWHLRARIGEQEHARLRALARRLRDVPAALEGFGTGLRQYEGVWYGFGVAGAESYQALRMTWEEMRRNA